MPTNTNQNTPYRDKFRESLFYDAYKLETEITVTNFLDNQGNWEMCVILFKYKGQTFAMIEYFKKGYDNSTDYVQVELNGKLDTVFDRCIDAELYIVDKMRSL